MAENTPYVTGLFPDRDSAERAYQGVVERGYKQEDITLVMSDETRKRHFGDGDARTTELGSKAAEGAGIGAGIGGTVGAVAAALAAVGTSIALPGLGLVIAGPVAAALAGAGAGGAAGTLVGALVGWNIPEVRVKEYEADIKKGGILMGLRPRSEQDAVALADQWRACKGANVYGSAPSTSSLPSTFSATSTTPTVPTTVTTTVPSSTATTATLR
jgi:hypothetical protein